MRAWSVAIWLMALGAAFSARADHGPETWNAAADSVVRVLPTWPGFDRPGFGAPLGSAPMGSGVFWSIGEESTTWILTAAHVITDAVRVEIETYQGGRFDVDVAYIDTDADLAVLKAPVHERGLSLVTDEPPVGTHVCALGYPFGLPLSLSCGVVSGVNRSDLGFNAVENFIQTDAAVNPGSSGGALVDASGRLVGLVAAIFTKEADIDAGVNFAISAETIRTRLNAVISR